VAKKAKKSNPYRDYNDERQNKKKQIIKNSERKKEKYH
jgi:hypothetical protein